MKTFTLKDITAVTFNWCTARQTRGAAVNFKKYYPDIPMLIADDGSLSPKSKEVWSPAYNRVTENAKGKWDLDQDKMKNIPGVEFIEFEDHMGHGITIDRILPYVKTELMLTMDSDIRILGPGLVEEYLEKFNEDPENIYGVGTKRTEDFMAKEGPYFYTWLDPWFTLWNMEPLHRYPRVSFVELFTPGRNQYGCGCVWSMFMEYPELHRPRPPYHAVFYPIPEQQPRLYHLKKIFGVDDDELTSNWNKYIDG